MAKGLGVVALLAALGLVMAPAATAAEHEEDKADIVDTAAGNDQFATLVQAIEAAELAETLKGEGPFTVFAPTNEAFEQLPEGELERLLEPQNQDELRKILTYHVVAGKVMASDVTQLEGIDSADGAAVATVQGAEATLKMDQGQLMIDDATVTKTDVKASNGVIHVIDQVIVPEQ
jgi:uncharacterized surface protein with fasciclin (FAS1) repeats